MTTSYVQVPLDADRREMRCGRCESSRRRRRLTEIYLTGKDEALEGVVPLSRLILALPETRIAVLAEPRIISCPAEAHQDEVAELLRQVQSPCAAGGG